MTTDVGISILIPAWDEEGAIGSVVRDGLAACRAAGLSVECLVCVDARTADRTSEIARRAGARAILQQSRGLTAAVLEAAATATGAVCLVLDGDGQHDARRAVQLIAPVLAGDADLVTGARDPRSLRGGFGNGVRGAVRFAGCRLLGLAARTVVCRGIPDPFTGMFACRRADLLALGERAHTAPPGGYKLLLGLLAAVPPARTCHVTVPFLPRRAGASKLDARVVFTTLRQLLRMLLSKRPATPGWTEGIRRVSR